MYMVALQQARGSVGEAERALKLHQSPTLPMPPLTRRQSGSIAEPRPSRECGSS